ncbi:hypothetical protein Tco_0204116 [Tanacetum coccineum]
MPSIDQSAGVNIRDKNTKESWAIIEDLILYDNESWNDLRDLAKSVKVISLPFDVPSISDQRLIELENQVQCLMEAQISPKPSVQVNNITSSYEICSDPHNTQYCMENPEQAFVDYASSCTDEEGRKWFTIKPEKDTLGRLKLLVDFYVLDKERGPMCLLLLGRGFLATTSVVIDCKKSKISLGKGYARTDFIGSQCPSYLENDFMSTNSPGAWKLARDAKLNPFKDALVSKKMIDLLGAIPINIRVANGSQKTCESCSTPRRLKLVHLSKLGYVLLSALSERQDLFSLLGGLCLHEGTDDGWNRLLDPMNSFSVKHISRLIDDATLGNSGSAKSTISSGSKATRDRCLTVPREVQLHGARGLRRVLVQDRRR